ncbi:MAG: Ribosomal RNA small subunit methyltransferase H [Phycisphaerae bacterium]|nr:Ribosomal RNA small subunit methyltransferase H [Phycisphaerae bacterium]
MTPESDQPRRRRPRYPGNHPRRFDQRYKEHQPDIYPEMQDHIRAQGRTPAGTHVPILLKEVLEALHPRSGERVADCTLGYGGHALALLQRIGPQGQFLGLDVDAMELERTRMRLCDDYPHVRFIHSNFAGLQKQMHQIGWPGFDLIFADLGVSSMQLDNPERGFSFKQHGPLDLRMNPSRSRTAADLLQQLTFEELVAALRDLADEPDASTIAELIVQTRTQEQITTTTQLVSLIQRAKKSTSLRRPSDSRSHTHPAARTFQALRMLVNDELAALQALLRQLPDILLPGGRVGIISFHSGEDRLIKAAFKSGRQQGFYRAISEDVIRPTAEEIHNNPRSRSAKFRWAIRG